MQSITSGSHIVTKPCPLLQIQYLGVQHPSDRKISPSNPSQRSLQSGSGYVVVLIVMVVVVVVVEVVVGGGWVVVVVGTISLKGKLPYHY